MKTKTILSSLLGLSSLIPMAAQAASLNGSELSLAWAIPFAGILLCIALCPLLCAHFWHHNFGKVAVGWALACAIFTISDDDTGSFDQIMSANLLSTTPN